MQSAKAARVRVNTARSNDESLWCFNSLNGNNHSDAQRLHRWFGCMLSSTVERCMSHCACWCLRCIKRTTVFDYPTKATKPFALASQDCLPPGLGREILPRVALQHRTRRAAHCHPRVAVTCLGVPTRVCSVCPLRHGGELAVRRGLLSPSEVLAAPSI